MYKEWKIAVVVPAYNEAQLIAKTVTTIPDFIDIIIVVDDKSTDDTATIVKSLQRDCSERLILITHERNRGVGGAIKTGYEKALALDMDIIVVMGGDAQMDPDQLPKLLEPIIEGRVDYTKGNRLEQDENLEMPRIRRFGNGALTLLTKIASGYWGVIDPENGYTAISRRALKEMRFSSISILGVKNETSCYDTCL
jgi:glycosyltransferase involved in cell wall biosynthesis